MLFMGGGGGKGKGRRSVRWILTGLAGILLFCDDVRVCAVLNY